MAKDKVLNLKPRYKKGRKQDLKKFVVCIEANVLETIVTFEHKYSESGERRFGSSVSLEEAGQSYSTEIKIKNVAGVEKLLFRGACPLEKGDRIKAYIFKAGKKEESHKKTDCYDKGTHTVYLERDFDNIENTFKIQTLSDLAEVLTTYVDKDLHFFIYLKHLFVGRKNG